MELNRMQDWLSAALLLLVALVCASASATPLQSTQCPATSELDDDAGCVKLLTGCVCIGSGGGTVASLPDCGGCIFSFSGTVNCTNPYYSFSFGCTNVELECGSRSACGAECPCTLGTWLPVIFGCGKCP